MVLVRKAHQFRNLPHVRTLYIIAAIVYIMRISCVSHGYIIMESDSAGAQSAQVPQFSGRPKPSTLNPKT